MVNIKASSASDVGRMCRSCLCKPSKLIPLDKPNKQIARAKSEFVDSCETIGQLMMTCADVRIEADDGLPQNVCEKCVADIRAAFVYRQKCERSDAELRELFLKPILNAVVKLERHEEVKASEDTELGPTEGHWFEAVEPEIVSEIDLKAEDNHSCSGFDDSMFQVDFESTSAQSFGGDDGAIDIFEEKHVEHGKAGLSSEKEYTCDICSKVFNRKYNWMQHKLVHSDEKNFKCTVCSQEYKSKHNLKRHLRSHGENQGAFENIEDKFRCKICSKGFTRSYALNQHKLEHTEVERAFSCGTCGREYKTRHSAISCRHIEAKREESGEKHLNKGQSSCKKKGKKGPTGKIFVCEVCSKVFNRKFNLRQHQMIHAGRKNFSCDICKSEFMKKSVLRRHLEQHVKGAKTGGDSAKKLTNGKSERTQRFSSTSGERKKKVKREKVCEICSKVFSRTYNLNQHRKQHTGENRYTCNVCQREYKSRRSARSCRHLKERRRRSDAENFSCDICGYEFLRKSQMRKHFKIQHEIIKTKRNQLDPETGEKKKKICEFCSKEFTRTYNLNQHRLVHTGECRFSCDICKCEYKSKRNLKAHILRHSESRKERVRNGEKRTRQRKYKVKVKVEKKYVCEVCAKVFKSPNNLHQHYLVHTNVREFSCDICKRRYKTKNHIKNHMRTHYAGDNIYSHLCSVCGTRYQNVTRLNEHMRVHTGERPYECDICHKAFHKLYNMTCHKRIHSLVKPHICAICGRGFTIKDRLRVHMMLHTGERPYKCNMCPAGFVQGCLLKVHMRTHTGERPYLCGICGSRFQHRSQILKHRRKFEHFEPKNENEFRNTTQTEAKFEAAQE